jgi:hypothetical protein
MMALGQCKRGRKREVRIEGELATMNSGVSTKRRGGGTVATNLMENTEWGTRM